MKDTIWIKKGRFTPLAVVLMFAFPLVTALICLCFGRMNVPVGEVLTALRTALTGESTSNVQNYSIVINLRLPRILMAIIVGAGLSCAGNAYQSLFSNPLATPDILGVTSGTCVGAILAIILPCSILETQLIALVFGLISVCFTLKVAGKSDGRSMVYLVLAGTIASSLFNALGSLLKYTADPQDKLPEITYWLLGSFTSASYQKILIGCPLIVAGIIIIYLLRWRLNILSLSDDEARASGINIKQTRMLFIVASTLITASAVSMCGQVGWIGLLIPHACFACSTKSRFISGKLRNNEFFLTQTEYIPDGSDHACIAGNTTAEYHRFTDRQPPHDGSFVVADHGIAQTQKNIRRGNAFLLAVDDICFGKDRTPTGKAGDTLCLLDQ